MPTHNFDPSILREYDVRGIVGRTLGPDDARALGRGFATRVPAPAAPASRSAMTGACRRRRWRRRWSRG